LLLAMAAASALLGIAQLATGENGMLYFYTQTNPGLPVGLFANRNHNAVFLATILLIASFQFSEHRRLALRNASALQPVLIVSVCALALGTVLFSQSRGGLLIGVLAMGAGLALYLAARRGEIREDHHHRKGPLRYWPIAATLVITLAVLFVFSQSTSFDRLATHSAAEDIRIKVLPQVMTMANANWVFGTGFGTFEYAYRAYEASEWLNPNYFNNAHDDWLQWVIEGGLPAILVALGFWGWIARACYSHWQARESNPALVRLVATALGVLILLLIASALDYPLRVPSMMLYAILMAAIIADPAAPQAKASTKRKSTREKSDSPHQPVPAASELKGAVQ
jgi:O-antigen ligase